MAAPNRQEARIGKLETPFGPDRLVLTRFEGREGLNELFEIRIEAVAKMVAGSTAHDIDFDAAIGRHIGLSVRTVDGKTRHFDGILTGGAWTGVRHDNYVYTLVIRPWLHLLSFRTDCFIFHNKTAPEVIEQVFQRHGFANFESRLTRNYPTLEYCVQYRESDLDFVRRLMEENGINFYFVHRAGSHTLVMADDYSSYEQIPGAKRRFLADPEQHRRPVEHFSAFTPSRAFTSGAVMVNDYDFKKPSANMKADKTGDAAYANGKLELYDYPGRYVEKSDGTEFARVRVERARSEDGGFHAAGDCVSAFPGALVRLEKHPESPLNQEYLVLVCEHSFVTEEYRSSAGGNMGPPYQGQFDFTRADIPYRPPLVTPPARVFGPQTAKVVGEGEIDVDEHGRILVRFHWDRESDQSRRVRVAQVWSGKNWGGIFIPRVGMEVIVEFLEGDPDQPLVMGTVYNGENKPPFPLPAEKNIAGIKSNSTEGGGGYNEYVFDDTKGSELIRQHGQKDLDSVVENDERWRIKRDRGTWIDRDEKREIGRNRVTTIKANDTLDVTDTITIKAGKKIHIEVGKLGPKSTITITPDTIEMKTANLVIDTSATFKSKTLLGEHDASAQMKITGGIVKIN